MTSFIIRPPEEKDIEALAALHFYMWNEFYKDYVPVEYSKATYTIEQCREHQHKMLQEIASTDKALALVAIDAENGNLAGLCYINQNDRPPDHDLYIPDFELELQRLYIWPEYRDNHVAGRLFQSVLRWAKQHRYYSVFWWVLDLNAFSHIHGKRGAKVVKQMPRDYTGTILNLTAYGMEL